ncbi:toxin-antitoxin system YwqK family antitoxin [Chitinophaga rhizophila]|uniref:MORN repeat protein n=1 Tax=Chitinophaga rhizophila TaxID=2866212 RepID=A0ABS7G752_9BACT|nr:hypothetical protein [Chitinophaga rhizophila]MBW8683236.1 hypothetical protein [Chitinophaga rhizophila]
MTNYSRLLSGLLLLSLTTVAWGCADAEEHNTQLLRQILREENGCIRWKVYGFSDDPHKEKVEVYFTNGKVKEVFYRHQGHLEGLRTVYYDNGALSESGNWHQDSRVGEFRYYRQDGQLECVQYYGLIGESIEAR